MVPPHNQHEAGMGHPVRYHFRSALVGPSTQGLSSGKAPYLDAHPPYPPSRPSQFVSHTCLCPRLVHIH